MAGNRAANFALQNADLVLVLANRMTSMITGENINTFVREGKIITVDIDQFEHRKFGNKIEKSIVADVKLFLQTMLQKSLRKTNIEWTNKCSHWKKNFPKSEQSFLQDDHVDLYELADILTQYMDDDAVCIIDSGLADLIIPTSIYFKKNQRCIRPISQGAMGFALPALIGSYFADPKQNIAVIGDGSVMMNLQELQTISYHKLPVKILIINNNIYSVIRKRQLDLFRTRTIGTDSSNGISTPDFAKVANTFEIRYEKIEVSSQLAKLKGFLKLNEPVICEIVGKDNQNYIHTSFRKNEQGRFVHPPIEDQSPFLDRDLFNREMIIKPVN